MGDFQEDLTQGEKAELYVVEQLKLEYPSLRKEYGYNKAYDLIDDDGYTVEVKYDRESIKTGNIAFEYKYNGRPSGISTSTALDWVQIYFYKYWVFSQIRTKNLKMFLKLNSKYFKKTMGGDNNKSHILLVPVSYFDETFCSRRIAISH